MISALVDMCHNRYLHSSCATCTYQAFCPHDCSRCLHYIHTPTAAPAPRHYDCVRMMDFYVCKYAHKYTSELYYAFDRLSDASTKRRLRVLSIGCGPCTDLLALNMLQRHGKYCFDTIEYRGIELNTAIWENVLQDLGEICPEGYDFQIANVDACTHMEALLADAWRPDIISLQYVFSDMQKSCSAVIIDRFIASLARYFDTCEDGSYLVCNDINLTTDRGGAINHFDRLLVRIQATNSYRKNHFDNSNRPRHFEYGDEYPRNALICQPPNTVRWSDPYLSCSSAQLIVKKVSE